MVFTVKSTTDEIVAELDLGDKTAVITGSSGGLGAETARALASKGASVVLVARDAAKLEAKQKELRELTGNKNISCVLMDLADLNSVRRAADEILTDYPKIHMLINNAGVMATPFEKTVQGFELQFGVNHVGHFLFATSLIPALEAAAPSRIVILSSGAHKMGNVDFDDLNWEKRKYSKLEAYGASKTANALFATELHRRLAPKGVTANAVHPGVIFTELGRYMTKEDIDAMLSEGTSLRFKEIECGAATTVWAAASPDLEGQGGFYLEDCHVGVELGLDHPMAGYCDWALDAENAQRLWQVTEELIAAHS
jgi:NAD(P)-dependent dehydrogenase (short-subunit alcohol dehydrogenase family)